MKKNFCPKEFIKSSSRSVLPVRAKMTCERNKTPQERQIKCIACSCLHESTFATRCSPFCALIVSERSLRHGCIIRVAFAGRSKKKTNAFAPGRGDHTERHDRVGNSQSRVISRPRDSYLFAIDWLIYKTPARRSVSAARSRVSQCVQFMQHATSLPSLKESTTGSMLIVCTCGDRYFYFMSFVVAMRDSGVTRDLIYFLVLGLYRILVILHLKFNLGGSRV